MYVTMTRIIVALVLGMIGGTVLGIVAPTLLHQSNNKYVLINTTIKPATMTEYELRILPNATKTLEAVTNLTAPAWMTLNLSNVDLAVNDAVAPILYDWYFDGVDDYLAWTYGIGNFSYVDVRAGVVHECGSVTGVVTENQVSYYGFSLDISSYIAFGIGNGTVWHSTTYTANTSTYHDIRGLFDGNYIRVYVDGVEVASRDVSDLGGFTWFTVDDIAIGSQVPLGISLFRGRISYVYYEFKDRDTGAIDKYLFSATFYNGTHYIDIINNVPLTVHGDIARIPSEHPFLWLVKGLASDNMLHLKFFPKGSIIEIYSSNGGLLANMTIDCVANPVGLCVDYAVPVALLENVTIRARVPMPDYFIIRGLPEGLRVKVNGQEYTVGKGGLLTIFAAENQTLNISAVVDGYRAVEDDPWASSVVHLWKYDPETGQMTWLGYGHSIPDGEIVLPVGLSYDSSSDKLVLRYNGYYIGKGVGFQLLNGYYIKTGDALGPFKQLGFDGNYLRVELPNSKWIAVTTKYSNATITRLDNKVIGIVTEGATGSRDEVRIRLPRSMIRSVVVDGKTYLGPYLPSAPASPVWYDEDNGELVLTGMHHSPVVYTIYLATGSEQPLYNLMHIAFEAIAAMAFLSVVALLFTHLRHHAKG